MAGKKTAVFGIYRTIAQAEQSVDRLLMEGFSNDDIFVLLPDNQGTKEFAHEKNTKAPEGTTTGVATGGAVGGTLGLLAGIGALAIPAQTVPEFSAPNFFSFPSTFHQPTYYKWNFEIQQELAPKTVLRINDSGMHGSHIPISIRA